MFVFVFQTWAGERESNETAIWERGILYIGYSLNNSGARTKFPNTLLLLHVLVLVKEMNELHTQNIQIEKKIVKISRSYELYTRLYDSIKKKGVNHVSKYCFTGKTGNWFTIAHT